MTRFLSHLSLVFILKGKKNDERMRERESDPK